MNMNFPPMIKKSSSTSNNPEDFKVQKFSSLGPHAFNKWKTLGSEKRNLAIKSSQETSKESKFIKKKQSVQTVTNKYPYNQVDNLYDRNSSTRQQKTVLKSKSINIIPKKGQESKESKTIIRVIPKKELEYEKKTFEWRMTTHFPVIKIQINNFKQVKLQRQNEVFTELELKIAHSQDILFTLDEIEEISLLNSIYILNQALVSFQRLFNRFGYFQPTLKMIFITHNLKCKVWLNENICQNTPNKSFISSKLKKYQKVEEFYKRTITLFSNYFKSNCLYLLKQTKRNVNLIEKLVYELQTKKDFVQGLKFINDFLYSYSLKLNHRYIITENRSRIQSTSPQQLQTSRPLTKQGSKNYVNFAFIPSKTLTTAHNSPFDSIKQSNIKTIGKGSYHFRLNQLDFKRKSQVSICSKQTVVEKKPRFSMYDPNETDAKPNNLPEFHDDDFSNIEEQQNAFSSQISVPKDKQLTVNLRRVSDQEHEQEVRNQIQSKIRQQNGWLLAPNFMQAQEFAKSIQGSEPSIKMRGRDRALTKLNRIKRSITNSIMEGSVMGN